MFHDRFNPYLFQLPDMKVELTRSPPFDVSAIVDVNGGSPARLVSPDSVVAETRAGAASSSM